MSARQTLDAVRCGKVARRARHLRSDAASFRPHRRDAGGAGGLRHQRQDEPAAARGRRPRRDAGRASPTAASTSSRPITRRITTTRSASSSTARRSASPASKRRCRCASIAWCTPASIPIARLVELLSVNPARILARAGRFACRGRAGRHHDAGAGPGGHRLGGARCARSRRTRRSTAGTCAAASPRPSSAAGPVYHERTDAEGSRQWCEWTNARSFATRR
mgnify:CR=1 FL=1